MADAVDLAVDLTELQRVRDELQALISSLTDLRAHPRPPAGAEEMGSADVAEAVERFRQRWGDAGERITENLRACLRYADNALQQYRTTEQALCGPQEGVPGTIPGTAL
ncbi:MAG TPA: hypothetical protein VD903_16885 [Pseudonocardia sp.]|nr:hypothetical protein [Pseudonocardia sp.]